MALIAKRIITNRVERGTNNPAPHARVLAEDSPGFPEIAAMFSHAGARIE
jgi:hypothetical protein